MSIDRKTVNHVAMLARLALTDEERERTQEQLSAILEHINVITEADTSQVPATAHILPVENVMAADQSRPSCSPDELWRTPRRARVNTFRVQAVLEE